MYSLERLRLNYSKNISYSLFEFGNNNEISGDNIKQVKEELAFCLSMLGEGGVLRVDFNNITKIQYEFYFEISKIIKKLILHSRKGWGLNNKFLTLHNVPNHLLPEINSIINKEQIAIWIRLVNSKKWAVAGNVLTNSLKKHLEYILSNKNPCTPNQYAMYHTINKATASRILATISHLRLIRRERDFESINRGSGYIYKTITPSMKDFLTIR